MRNFNKLKKIFLIIVERQNPRYMEDEMYGIDCQTCMLAYETYRSC